MMDVMVKEVAGVKVVPIKLTKDNSLLESKIWASRPGLCTLDISREEEGIFAKILLTRSFDPSRDFIVLETNLTAGPIFSYQFCEVYGNMPAWAIYPSAWHDWVNKYREEAESFLCSAELFTEETWRNKILSDLANFAVRKKGKDRIREAWMECVDFLKKHNKLPADWNFPNGDSWTSTKALPIRLASALGWRSDEPKPRYENPKQAKRHLAFSATDVSD